MTGRRALLALLLAAGPIGGGCRCARGPVAPVFDAGAADEDAVRPVYEDQGRAPEALAVTLCDALHKRPEQRRAACCQGSEGIQVAPLCARTLSVALRSGAVAVDPAAVTACAAAMEAAHAGCSWVGPEGPPFPPACERLVKGTLAAGARCRSALECQPGLRCAGGGPTDVGRCAPPGPDGTACALAVDTLATYTRQPLELDHRECPGYCERHLCRPPVQEGAACQAAGECAAGSHCAAGKCAPGAVAAAGEACVAGECGAGLRCVTGTCRAPAPEGTACQADAECQGACLAHDGGGKRCGMGCAAR